MAEQAFLAIDIGASSGRHVVGHFDGERLRLEEVYRFENGPVDLQGSLHWDLLRQWTDVKTGLSAAAAGFADQIASVGIDTWGVDFGLLGPRDVLLANPHHYRDPRTDGLMDEAFKTVSREDIFAATGLQFLPFNTLFQLLALKRSGSPVLDVAERLLMMPDLFHWLMTGEKTNEFTNATTTQFYSPRERTWATDLLARFDLPTHILGDVIEPGTTIGPLSAGVAAESGLTNVRVVAPGTHDTASAVMAVPAAASAVGKPNWCYISSGTWSLMGAEVSEPVVNDRCVAYNFTNEGGVGKTYRLLKNIAGLWLVQECRRVWNKEGPDYSWDDLNRMSAAAPSHATFVEPDDAAFLAPGDMPAAIREYCRRTGQTVPGDEGAVIRCAVESLAMKCRRVLSWLEDLLGHSIETIHIVGGGTQNKQLCQATASACGRRVLAGPVEATAIGNLMVQAIAAGAVASIDEARSVIRRSFVVEEYEPEDADDWREAYERFIEVTGP